MSQDRIAELRKELKAKKAELQVAEAVSWKERNAALVGKFLRSMESFGADSWVKWTAITGVDHNHMLVGVSFLIWGNGDVVVRKEISPDGEEITREEFRMAWIEMRDGLRRFESVFTS